MDIEMRYFSYSRDVWSDGWTDFNYVKVYLKIYAKNPELLDFVVECEETWEGKPESLI